MSTIENLFVRIFKRKKWIVDQLKQHSEFFDDQSLASKCLINGIQPPSWLLQSGFKGQNKSVFSCKGEILNSPAKPKIVRSGFRFSSTAEDVTKNIDDAMLTAIVTGGSSGLQLETVRVLALRGAHVVIGARNLKCANDAKENPTARIDILKLDLCSMKSVFEGKPISTI